jgi:predicted acyl esterase
MKYALLLLCSFGCFFSNSQELPYSSYTTEEEFVPLEDGTLLRTVVHSPQSTNGK